MLAASELVFGWRQSMKLRLNRARIALAAGAAEDAEHGAAALAAEAEALGVPRYAVPARLLGAQAQARRGKPVDVDRVAGDLSQLPDVAALEAWQITAALGHDLEVRAWWDRAEEQAAQLARHAGLQREQFETYARARLDALRP